MTVADSTLLARARSIQSMVSPWQPSSCTYGLSTLLYSDALRDRCAMGAKVPSDRPDFDPNKVEGTPEELITTRVDVRDFLLPKMNALRERRRLHRTGGSLASPTMSCETNLAWSVLSGSPHTSLLMATKTTCLPGCAKCGARVRRTAPGRLTPP
jgi:hypothetical protein